MTWKMPAETAPHERIWMAFPRPGVTLGEPGAEADAGYEAWTSVAHAIMEFEPVTMVVDPVERDRARRMLSSQIELVEAPLDDFWMRDFGPTFVFDECGHARRRRLDLQRLGRPGVGELGQRPRDRAIHRGAARMRDSSRRRS